jgi:hypothetical protein
MVAQGQQELAEGQQQILKAVTAPRRTDVVRGKDNRVSHAISTLAIEPSGPPGGEQPQENVTIQ